MKKFLLTFLAAFAGVVWAANPIEPPMLRLDVTIGRLLDVLDDDATQPLEGDLHRVAG